MLDVVPAVYQVKVIRRPRYGCHGCEGAIVQAPAPERPLTGGMATEALLAQVLVVKYSDHPPLIARPRSLPATASISTVPPWPTGSGAPAGGCARWPSCCSARSSPHRRSSPARGAPTTEVTHPIQQIYITSIHRANPHGF
jgi:hypothetical protein